MKAIANICFIYLLEIKEGKIRQKKTDSVKLD